MLDGARILALLAAQTRIRRWLIGYSGGVDSHVLLHWLAAHRDNLAGQVTAAYVDHGLQADSQRWGEHCAAICQALGVAFQQLQVNAHPQRGESPEAAARRARYRVFMDLLSEDAALVTAHHRDDQAETLLLQLLRGAGPRGLAAMPAVSALGRGILVRPLLDVGRADILAYAEQHGLGWISDPSNTDRGFDRNYLRHEILPRLAARWPAVNRALARSAALAGEAAALLDELADADLHRAAGVEPNRLHVGTLRSLNEPRLRNALRLWFEQLRLPAPQRIHLDHIVTDAIAAPADSEPLIRWPGCEVRRYRDGLYALAPLAPHDAGRVIPWSGLEPLSIAGIGILALRAAVGEGLRIRVPCSGLTVRFRQGGECIRLRGRSHELKKLFQGAGILPWERERIPLLYIDDELAAVAGLWIAAKFAAAVTDEGLVLQWQRHTAATAVLRGVVNK